MRVNAVKKAAAALSRTGDKFGEPGREKRPRDSAGRCSAGNEALLTRDTKKNFRGSLRETAAFASAGRGTGATFDAVCCANYFSSVRGRRVALAEVSGRNELSFAANDDLVINGGVCGFHYLGVDIFPGLSVGDLPEIYDMPYDLVVLDCGEAAPGLSDLRADALYISASSVPWRRDALTTLFDGTCAILPTETAVTRSGKILLLTPEERERKRLSAELRRPVISVPFIADPFRLTQANSAALAAVFAPEADGKRRLFTRKI